MTQDRKAIAGGWFLTFLHSPVLGFWIMTAALAVAASVELFRSPRHALELASGVALMATLTRAVARMKGVSPWPIRLGDDDDDEPLAIGAGEHDKPTVVPLDELKSRERR